MYTGIHHFTALLACCSFYKLATKIPHQQKDHESLYCDSRFIPLVWAEPMTSPGYACDAKYIQLKDCSLL